MRGSFNPTRSGLVTVTVFVAGGGKIQAHCGFNVHTAYKVRLVFGMVTEDPGPYVGVVAVFEVPQPAKYQAPDVQLAGSVGEGMFTLVAEPIATS